MKAFVEETKERLTRMAEEGGKVTIDLGTLMTIDIDQVRLVEKYRAPKRKKPLRDMLN
ncbi:MULTISPECIES: hypothetical protein [unclassified Mesorhizobium]|uniref:hypothetical protein n=1 Tax=unclassified Mesorhizobium TaxID=325217 RepID=UPI00333A9039